jgi:hypothetical protein
MEVNGNEIGLKLNGTRQLLAYIEEVNLLGDNIDTINRNMETIIDVSKEVSREVKVKTSIYYCLCTRMQAKIEK